MDPGIPVDPINGFDWDDGNRHKNWLSHGVGFWECEEVFFNRPLFLFPDEKHSGVEERMLALGRTGRERRLTVVFTVRQGEIRVISARDINRLERESYDHET